MKGRAFSLPRAALFVLMALAALYVNLLPMQLEAQRAPLPDLLIVLCAAWGLRQPEDLPLMLIAAVLLIGDLVLDRPVGLWAVISLLMLEILRGRREALYDRPFAIEWATFAVALAGALLVQSLVLRLALVEPPAGGTLARLWLHSTLAYPAVVALLHWVLRVRAPKPVERSRRLGRVA